RYDKRRVRGTDVHQSFHRAAANIGDVVAGRASPDNLFLTENIIEASHAGNRKGVRVKDVLAPRDRFLSRFQFGSRRTFPRLVQAEDRWIEWVPNGLLPNGSLI